MRKKRLRVPFVITIGATASACGGIAIIDDGAGGASSTSGKSQATAVAASTGAKGSTGSSMIDCPMGAPSPFQSCGASVGTCTYPVNCQSGLVELSFTCTGMGFWEIVPAPCGQPYDSCPGTEFYCDGTWWMPEATNPPSPCPQEKPAVGEVCFGGGMGGVWQNCGYWCTPDDPASGWTVRSCVPPDGMGNWTSDGVCP